MQKHTLNSLHILITGDNRGIGLEMTKQLLTRGARVTASARNATLATELQQLNRDFSTLQIVNADVTDAAQVHSLAMNLKGEAIDILINNAGVYLDGEFDFADLDLELVQKSFEINALGAMRVTQSLLPNLQKSKNPKVINISSLMGSIEDNTSGGTYGYRMSKAALNMFTKTLANDFPKITAITMHPGWVKTDMGGKNAPTEKAESVRGLLNVILNVELKQSGQFIDFENDKLPW